jgi:non-specific serine/threonine protein kinase
MLITSLALGPADQEALVGAARQSAATSARPRALARNAAQERSRFPGAELPVIDDSLVGRERELAEVTTLLHGDGARLVTLTGPGGVGKTRLALQVAADLRDEFAGGVAFVPLAAISDAALVLPTIAQALGVRETQSRSPEEAVAVALRGQHTLLVLDNLEQVLDAAPAIGRLLAAAPELRLLVTSRVALRLSGEQRYLVSPLPMPDPAPAHASDDLVDSPALRLFARRARQVRSDFSITSDNVDDVAMICRRLDGLPLAIELAAARVAVLAPSALLARLEHALPLLSGGARDQPERLQTMRAAIAWSYDLLPRESQALFRKLAVFEGGFTLEAATAVCRTDDNTDVVIFEVVAELVEASLLRAEDGPNGESRFSFLETIREYGIEQLAAYGEEELTRERHAAWALALAEKTEPELFRTNQQTWWRRLEAERPNIREALAWFEQTGDAERALRLAGAITPFNWMRGYLREGQDWLQRSLAIHGDTSPAALAWGLFSSGTLTWFRGEYQTTQALLERALALSRDGDFALGIALSHHMLAMAAWMQGDLQQALVLSEEAITRERELADPRWLAILLDDAATVALLCGDDERGKAWSTEGLALNRALGNRWNIGIHHSDLGVVAQSRGDLTEAARHYAESVHLFHELGDTWYIASPLAGLAAIAVVQGRPQTAARLLGVAMALREASGSAVWATERERDEQTVARARATLGEEDFARALEAGRKLSLTQAVDEAVSVTAAAGTERPG